MCTPGFLTNCGVCCLLLCIWAVIQLTIMGIFYKLEATPLIGDVEADEYEDYAEFIQKTKEHYKITAINCWLTAVIYMLVGLLSIFCIVTGRNKKKKADEKMADDDLFCFQTEEPRARTVKYVMKLTKPIKKLEKKKEETPPSPPTTEKHSVTTEKPTTTKKSSLTTKEQSSLTIKKQSTPTKKPSTLTTKKQSTPTKKPSTLTTKKPTPTTKKPSLTPPPKKKGL